MIVGFLILLVAGIACLVTGWLVWKKEKITLIHAYHYPFVKEENKKAYTAGIGKGVCIIGAGSVLAAAVNLATGSGFGWYLFALGFVAGWVMILWAQRKYNGGL